MEKLIETTVEYLLNRFKPNLTDSWSISKEAKELLDTLPKQANIVCYGTSSFRLADIKPSYYIEKIFILN